MGTSSASAGAAAAPPSAASSAPTAKTAAFAEDGAASQHPVAWYAVADAGFMSGHDVINARMRAILVEWLIEVVHKFKLQHGTLHLCINLLDRYLQVDKAVPTSRLQLMGVTALLIATKLLETHPVSCSDLVYMSCQAFTTTDVKQSELSMLEKLDGDVLVCTLSTALDERIHGLDQSGRELALYLADLTLVESRSCEFPPEQLAHACVSLAAPPVRGAEQAASAAATAHLRDLHGRAKDGAHFASIRKKHVLCEQRQLACPYNDF